MTNVMVKKSFKLTGIQIVSSVWNEEGEPINFRIEAKVLVRIGLRLTR
jgi:hypothetical protein